MPNREESYDSEEDVEETPQPTSAFSVEVVEPSPPHGFKIPHLKSYKWRTDLVDHIAYFKSRTSSMDLDDVMNCKLFFTTFKESTLRWFSRLPVKIITTLTESKRTFATQFASAQKPLKAHMLRSKLGKSPMNLKESSSSTSKGKC